MGTRPPKSEVGPPRALPPKPKRQSVVANADEGYDGADTDELLLGSVVGVFGVSGEVRLHLNHRESDLFECGRDATLTFPDGRRLAVWLKTRPGAGRRVLGNIHGITRCEQAEALVGADISIPREALPPLPEDEFYVAEYLNGLVFIEGDVVGRVKDVHHSGPVDVLEVTTASGPAFVALLRDNIVRFDRPQRAIHLASGSLDEG